MVLQLMEQQILAEVAQHREGLLALILEAPEAQA